MNECIISTHCFPMATRHPSNAFEIVLYSLHLVVVDAWNLTSMPIVSDPQPSWLQSLKAPLIFVVMNELKKHWNTTEFWCTMDEEEPHLCNIHLRTIIDTQLSPGFFYFYYKQEGSTEAHWLAHKLHCWIWTNIPSLEMIGCINGECSPLTTGCAKHHEQLAIPHHIA